MERRKCRTWRRISRNSSRPQPLDCTENWPLQIIEIFFGWKIFSCTICKSRRYTCICNRRHSQHQRTDDHQCASQQLTHYCYFCSVILSKNATSLIESSALLTSAWYVSSKCFAYIIAQKYQKFGNPWYHHICFYFSIYLFFWTINMSNRSYTYAHILRQLLCT